MKNPASSLRRARGVTLIEVLVTMVIVAVGLLGLAGLQVRGLSIQKDAHGRAIATQLALDIADRMRSNVSVVSTGSYGFTTTYPTGTYTPATVTDCEANVCTAIQQAQFDLDRWMARVRGGALPGGWAWIEPVAGTTAWNVTLIWIETGLRRSADPAVLAALPSNCPPAANAPQAAECVTIRVWP